MKQLNYYNKIGKNSEEEIFNYFLATLKDSIYTWDYFTDFKKSMSNANKYKKELDLLNTLIGLEEDIINKKLMELIDTNPKVREAMLLLIALRPTKIKETAIIDDFSTLSSKNKASLFKSKEELTDEMKYDFINFFEESGIKEFLVNREVSNLLDYCKGVEVGMDTNGRKNRTGTSMESICEVFVKNLCEENGFEYMEQATCKKIKDKWGINAEADKIDRRFDFAIKGNNNLYLSEVNFYSSGGSKLKATAGEYKDLHDLITNQGFELIWITDGVGWNTSKTAINETFIYNDYILNLKMLADGVLNEIVK